MKRTDIIHDPIVEDSVLSQNINHDTNSTPDSKQNSFKIDTSNIYTLRKGWLTLRGKSENKFNKYWVVLAGLSLKLYK